MRNVISDSLARAETCADHEHRILAAAMMTSAPKIEGFAYKQKSHTALLPGLVKRFWTFEPGTLTLTYSRKATDGEKEMRLLTTVCEDAEDIAPISIRAIPLTKASLEIRTLT